MRDYKLYIADIEEAIEKIQSFIYGLDFKSFKNDIKTYNSVIRLPLARPCASHPCMALGIRASLSFGPFYFTTPIGVRELTRCQPGANRRFACCRFMPR